MSKVVSNLLQSGFRTGFLGKADFSINPVYHMAATLGQKLNILGAAPQKKNLKSKTCPIAQTVMNY
jgi:hypothetical protein